MKVAVINSGSSSIKYEVFDAAGCEMVAEGLIERIGSSDGRLRQWRVKAEGSFDEQVHARSLADHRAGFELMESVNQKDRIIRDATELLGIGHRVVHGGGLFADTWVPAQPHDGGLSLGQALFVWHHVLGNPRIPRASTPYLGTDAGEVSARHIPDIVRFLEEGRSVGLCYGKAESGPRALGHRSILLDPRIPDGKDRLNREVKHREWYRPYAPMVLGDCGVPSKYMSYIVSTNADEVPAVTHVDGTTRPQIVDDGDDPFIVRLLRAWRDKTGCRLLLNTSFNCQEPLVNTVDEARATWKRTGLDVLVTPKGIETDKGA